MFHLRADFTLQGGESPTALHAICFVYRREGWTNKYYMLRRKSAIFAIFGELTVGRRVDFV